MKLDDEKNLAVEYVKTEEKIYRLQNISIQIDRHRANTKCVSLQEVVTETMVKRQEAKQKAKIFTQKYSEVMNEFNNLQSQLTTVQGEIKTNTKSFENYESEDIRINN